MHRGSESVGLGSRQAGFGSTIAGYSSRKDRTCFPLCFVSVGSPRAAHTRAPGGSRARKTSATMKSRCGRVFASLYDLTSKSNFSLSWSLSPRTWKESSWTSLSSHDDLKGEYRTAYKHRSALSTVANSVRCRHSPKFRKNQLTKLESIGFHTDRICA